MPQDDQRSEQKVNGPLSRRRLLALSGVVATGLAGCSGNSESTTTNATPTAGGGTATQTDSPTPTSTPEQTTEETTTATSTTVPPADQMSVKFIKNPADRIWNQLNWNKYPGAMLHLSYASLAPQIRGEGPKPVMVEDWSREGGGSTPPTFTIKLREGWPWSDGKHEVTAKDFLTSMYLRGPELRPWREDNLIKSAKAVDDYTAKVEFGRAMNPIRARGVIPLSNWHRPYIISPHWQWKDLIQGLKDATTQKERDNLLSEASQRNIGTGDVVTNGPWKIVDHSATKIVWEPLEGHPLADDLPAKRLVGKVAKGSSRGNQLLINDKIDIGGAPPKSIRSKIPDSYSQLATVPSDGGRKLHLNWRNKHIARVGVRRAIVALLNIKRLANLGSGMKPHEQVPFGPVTKNTWLSDSFQEKLYEYPVKKDTELAAEFMRKEGYTKKGGVWKDEEGNSVSLRMLSWPNWATMTESIATQLQEFGFKTKKLVMEQAQWFKTVNSPGGSYAMTLFPMPGKISNMFPGTGAGWNYLPHLEAPTEKRTANNKLNIAPLPKKVGALEIKGDGKKVNLAKTYQKYWNRASSEEDVKKCCRIWAQFYNFYLNDIALIYSEGQIWGDTATFDFPSEDATTYVTGKRPIWATVKSEFEDIEPSGN